MCVLAAALFGVDGPASAQTASPFFETVARLNPFKLRVRSPVPAASPAAVPAKPPAVVIADIPMRGTITTGPSTPVPARAMRPQDPPPAGLVAAPAVAPPVPKVNRQDVVNQLAVTSRDFTAAALSTLKPLLADPGRPVESAHAREATRVSLGQAIGAAVLSHPLMGAQAAKVSGSLADVRTSEGALKPQLQVYAGSGGSFYGAYLNTPKQFYDASIPGASRTDVGFTFRQLVYDFGAAKADVAHSKSLVSAERLRLADQAEDIALRTANAYMNLLEQSELITQINKVVADDNAFADLVQLSEKQGNGTIADVNRIKSKVIEVEATRTDIITAYKSAQDEFNRLTKLDPEQVRRSAPALPKIPRSVESAFETAKLSNPSLLSLSANGVSLDFALSSQKAQMLPRVDLQGDGLVKHYLGASAAAAGSVDSRLMVMLSYKLTDGGVMAAQADRIRSDKRSNDFKTLDEREGIELNIRRFYQALSANRTKEVAALQGTATAQKANTLYMEQFKSGKRTVFEVLDSRMVVFTMQKNAITGKYEQLRSAYGILRNMGKLVESAVRS
jgi:outer membrane protein, adhesin transport system